MTRQYRGRDGRGTDSLSGKMSLLKWSGLENSLGVRNGLQEESLIVEGLRNELGDHDHTGRKGRGNVFGRDNMGQP